EHPLGPRVRPEVVQGREPLDTREAVTALPARLGVEEVVGERVRIVVAVTQSPQGVEHVVTVRHALTRSPSSQNLYEEHSKSSRRRGIVAGEPAKGGTI